MKSQNTLQSQHGTYDGRHTLAVDPPHDHPHRGTLECHQSAILVRKIVDPSEVLDMGDH